MRYQNVVFLFTTTSYTYYKMQKNVKKNKQKQSQNSRPRWSSCRFWKAQNVHSPQLPNESVTDLRVNSATGRRLVECCTTKEKKKRNSEMWQVTYLPRPPTLRYPHQSCHVGWGPECSQSCQVSSKSVQGFWLPGGSKSAIFLCLALWLM